MPSMCEHNPTFLHVYVKVGSRLSSVLGVKSHVLALRPDDIHLSLQKQLGCLELILKPSNIRECQERCGDPLSSLSLVSGQLCGTASDHGLGRLGGRTEVIIKTFWVV